jgi:hypothetical protein
VNRKIPSDAFDFYFALGPGRSYEAVAKKFSVSKRAITTVASKEKWQERIATAQRTARERSDTKAVETLEDMHDKHVKALQFVFAKAIEALRTMPINTAMDAVKAIEIVVKQERLLRGDGNERTKSSVEEIIKREMSSMLEVVDDGKNDEGTATEQDGAV